MLSAKKWIQIHQDFIKLSQRQSLTKLCDFYRVKKSKLQENDVIDNRLPYAPEPIRIIRKNFLT